ncbi:hypothetical protein LNTAR_24646 [Lentisphaera araneosa HTCC2155]|uniref:AsmA-like C-terminal domain-containing protein n=1 Tax=Lentisphaera araneosa HTCC2155 TaxID=313628 RepID=A6DTA0_9BACT|nr:hypothetical protein [Lentisphaera araneosa]EDM25173.1 hypothetical protein LNTAR_24646 [Lentisphaera araneosa HTCC2155]
MLLKTWHIFRGVFSLAGMTLCILILILEIKGLPKNLILGLRQELDSPHLNFSIDEVHVGPISGIKINNISVKDDSQEKAIYQAEKIQVSFNLADLSQGLFTPESLQVRNANFNLKLKHGNEEEYLLVNQVNLNAKLLDHKTLKINYFECNTQNLNLQIQGELTNWVQTEKKDEASTKLLSATELNKLIPDHIKEAIINVNDVAQLLNITEKTSVKINFFVDVLQPEKSTAQIDLSLPEFLYLGSLVKSTKIRLQLKKDALTIPQFEINADNNETLSGHIEYELKSKKLSAQLKGQVFPFKYLKIFAPKLIKHVDFVKFNETPPSFNLYINNPNIDDYKQWEAQGTIKASNFQVQGLYVDLVEGPIKFKNLNFQSETLKLAGPQINGKVQVRYNFLNSKVSLYADASGDPRHISHFIFSDSGRRNYLNVWERFSWGRTAIPTWSGYFDYRYDPIRNEDLMTFDGEFKADGASINGVNTQKLSAKVYMQFPEQILVHNIQVDTTDTHARGHLGFKNVTNDCTIDYQFYSTISIPQTLRIANGEWKGLLDSLGLPNNSYARLTGHLNLDEALNARSEAYIELPEFTFNNLKIESPKITFNMRDKKIMIASRKADFYSGNMHFVYQDNLELNQQALKINATNIDLAGLISELQKDSLTTAAGRVNFGADIALKSKNGEIQSILGEGFVHIYDGLFLEIPFLSTFFNRLESILPFVSAAKVKEMSAQLKFFDQQVNIENFFSDGKLIALSGEGWFDWRQTMYLFNINTHYLKGILTLPKPLNVDILKGLFSPLSVLVKAEVRGDKNGYEWTINSMDNFKKSINGTPSRFFNIFKSDDER